MKTIGICGFAVLVAIIAALIGLGSASAVTLCSEGGLSCPASLKVATSRSAPANLAKKIRS
jgi:hypothetical protein